MPLAGRCVLIDDSGGHHLYLFLIECVGNPPQTILLNITSWYPGIDETCVLQPNDHPFIRTKSVIAYEYADILEEWRANILLRDGIFQPPIAPTLLLKIRQGLCESDQTPEEVKEFYQRYCT